MARWATMVDKTPKESFDEKYLINEQTDCWDWTGSIHAPNGKYPYPQFGIKKKQYNACRFSYEFFIEKIFGNLKIFQKCKNKMCVNPKHLFVDKFSKSDLDRFESGFVKGSDNECWNWNKSVDTKGYGMLMINGTIVRSHRYSYKTYNGAISDELVVRHTCDNTLCVNPNHLIKGTQAQNIQDSFDRGKRNHIKCGTLSSYIAKKCRCDACKKASSDYWKKYIRK